MQIEGITTFNWVHEVSDENLQPSPPTMLSGTEQKMLYWLAKSGHFQTIVDAGCFLGGSTNSFVRGLRDGNHEGIVHSYDIFLVPEHKPSQRLIGRKDVGGSVLPEFAKYLAGFEDQLVVHCGDIRRCRAPLNIDLLFIDVLKTKQISNDFLLEFFPNLQTDAIVIQQDHNEHSCYWVNTAMVYLEEFFEYLCDDSSSRVYRYRGGIKTSDIESYISASPSHLFEITTDAIEFMPEFAAYFTKISLAWLIYDQKGLAAATQYLAAAEKERPQPWDSPEPYSAQILSAFAYAEKYPTH